MSTVTRSTDITAETTRSCASCKTLRPIEEFEAIDPGHGTIDRRRICTPCINRVDELLVAGERNISAIARETGVSTPTIRGRRDALGIGRPAYRRLDDIDALTEMTLANTSMEEIASRLNVEVHTVRRYQQVLGLREKVTDRRVPEEVLMRAERMLREERTSYLETARTLGVDVDTLRRHFPGLGWTSEDRSTMASVLGHPDLKRLHLEIFGTASPG
ncbi:hypothetical protein [Microbacterium gorillae]|uniref:hypothetical protein n=1 Tax=Microbacterium gorillae TaxID=1231063 RepID=UPI003D986227